MGEHAANQQESESNRSEPPADPAEKQDTNSLVEGELRCNPNTKSKKIAEAIQRPDQTVRQTRAWKANRQRLKELRQQRRSELCPSLTRCSW